MIVGTAGHVDHGKTTLVRALTGIDTDRLKEEKARGISIELGYAYLPVDPGGMLGFVDVPGHERFVHTMAAGAAGLDHALLVVAADDGPMPQTCEHLAILALLGVARATLVLSKVDRVSPARLAQVRAEAGALAGGAGIVLAGVFETAASRDGDAGVAALRAHLEALAHAHAPRADAGPFRLAVDRVFTLAGQGTVVTGSVFSGSVAVGDALRHSASGVPVRVRGLHANNRAATRGAAGERCALNLAGIDRDAIARGDWILAERALRPTSRLDVRLRLLPDAGALGTWAPVHVHLGTAHRMAHVVPLRDERLSPGESARVQLVFDAPVVALAGDRFVVRSAAADRTLGGGEVLDPFAPARRRRGAARTAWLDALEAARAGGPVAALVALAPAGLARSQLALLVGDARAHGAGDEGLRALPLGSGGDALLMTDAAWRRELARVREALARFHAANPDEPGLNAARLRRLVLPLAEGAAGDTLWRALLDASLAEGHVGATGAWLHLPGHAPGLSDVEEALAARVLPWLDEGGADPPWVRELAARAGVPEEAMRTLMRKLSRQGRLHRVVEDLFYPPTGAALLLARFEALARDAGRAGVPAVAFRDATGLGRKRAIQILESFDRAGWTRRVRDVRLLAAGSGRRADPGPGDPA